MASKVTCTCGWSWNKSDSSKKDMYICHQCGKDNTMKDGGWLSKYNIPKAQKGKVAKYNPLDGEYVLDADGAIQTLSNVGEVMSASQKGVVKAITGKYQEPAEAMNITNPYAKFAVNAVMDPLNIFGIGLLGKAAKAAKATSAIKKGTSELSKAIKPNIQFNGVLKHEVGDIQYILDNLRTKGSKLDNDLSQSGISGKDLLHSDLIQYHGTYSGRPIVEVKMPDGTSEHFYKSSGWAGKEGAGANGTTEGMWQVYGGHANQPNTPNWFIKDANYQNYYGSDTFRSMAENMDNALINKYKLKDVNELDGAFNFRNRNANVDSVTPKSYKQNGGWLSKYNSPEAQNGIEGTMAGLTDKGFNYNGAWGGTMAMGGSLPGSVGFTYARTQDPAPSNGPYAKKTKASAQDGKKISYNQWKKQNNLKETSDYNLKRAWELGYTPDKTGHLPTVDNQTGQFLKVKGHPTLKLELDWYNSPEGAEFKSKNTLDSTGKFFKYVPKLQNGQEMKFYQEGLDWKPKNISQWGGDYTLDANQASQTLSNVGEVFSAPQKTIVKGITGKYQTPSEAMDIKNPYGAFAVDAVLDPLNLLGVGIAGKAAKASTKSGILSEAYKLNPYAFKPNESNWYRQVGDSAIDDAFNTGLIREAGEEVSPRMLQEFEEQLVRMQGHDMEAALASRRPTSPFFAKGELFYPMGRKPSINKVTGKVSKNPAGKGSADYLIETNLPNESFQPAYVKGMGVGVPTEIGQTAILKPNPSLRDLKNFNIYKQHWLKGYKQISKKENGGWLSKYQDGGIIEDDRGQWEYPGEITKINSNQITMQGVDYPVLGISDTGDMQMMQPGQDYTYKGKSVTEIPMAQNGYSEPDYVTGTTRRSMNKMIGMGNYLMPASALNTAADLAKSKGLDYGELTSGPADAVRHTAASASVASKLPIPKFIGDYSPNLERALRIAGANILGGGYELMNPNNEGLLMDIKNNYQGSLIGSIPGLSQNDRNKMIVNQLQKGKLTVDNPKKPKKENGGWLSKYN